VTLVKDGGGSQAYTTTISNNGITAPGGTISGGSGSTGTLPVTLVNNANGSASTGLKNYFVDISPLTPAADGHLDVSVTVLSQRSVTAGPSVSFGSVLRGASVSSSVALSTTGDDNNRTRVNVASTAGADGNGIGISAASGTLYNSAASTGTRTLSGTFSSYGNLSGSRSLAVTTAEAAGVSDVSAYAPVTISYTASVGNATADKSGSMTTFGPALVALVTSGGSYANLDSRVFSTSGAGGGPALNSVATLLEGTNSSGTDTGVSMEWRTRSMAETSLSEGGSPTTPPMWDTSALTSDVVNIHGMVNNAIADQRLTDVFVLQMTYSESLLNAPEALLAAAGKIHLAWLDPSASATGTWENAVLGNIGGPSTLGLPVLASYSTYRTGILGSHGAKAPLSFQLGDWGVDTTANVVWAVLNHNSQFASVPEPSSLALGALGLLGLVVFGWRRSARRR